MRYLVNSLGLHAGTVALAFFLVAGCASSEQTRERAGSPNVLTEDELDDQPVRRIEEMLRGQVAGVRVYERGGSLAIQIRGTSSIIGDGDPLFIVDGLPLEPGRGGVLDGISPQDVESISVLKNASDTAIYGARGANGVIVITTRRGG